MFYLPGIHEPDQQAEALFGDKPGTVVFAEAIGANPNDKSGRDYQWWSERGFRVIVRLNNGWFPDGTIPASSLYESFAQRCAAFVRASQGCWEWIIGNEFNHLQERPFGTEIKARDAARCFVLCRQAIKAVRSSDRVIVGAIAPWNQTSGDWLVYWKEMLEAIAANGGADGISLHAYTHGSDPALIASDQRVNGWLWHFRTYRDQLSVVPASMRHLPVDITETDQGDEAWVDANTGWVQAAMREINGWNQQPGTQKIRSVCLYRWPKYDQKYSFADKAGVQDDFREACKQGYAAMEGGGQTVPAQAQHDLFIPSVSTDGDNSGVSMPQHEISEEFKRRVPTIKLVEPQPGKRVYQLIKAEYLPPPKGAQRFGPDHHILVDVLDAQGKRMMGMPVNFYWGSGMELAKVNKVNEPYGADYGMTNHGQSYGVWVGNFPEASDDVFGMGLGTIEQPDWNHHVTYYLVFQEVLLPISQPTTPVKVPVLTHPIQDPAKRVISQPFGGNGEDYARFNLKGHNGIDFAVPTGTPVVAVDSGVVQESGNLPDYGEYVKLRHAWGESLYAHLSARKVEAGEPINRGFVIGRSGNTGNSTGPHLHFAMRVNPYTRGGDYDGFVDPLPYLINAGTPIPVEPGPFIPTQPPAPHEKQPPARESYLKWFRQYGAQFGIEWHLLAAMAYSENKYQVEPSSAVGALGLMQFMPLTWQDMQTQLGVTDPLDPEQSIKAAAYYLVQIRSYLLRYKRYSTEWVLAGYNWGMGRAAQGSWEQVPPETKAYIDEILEFSEALRRWEDGW